MIEWYKELYRDAMEPEVLSWDDSSNNRFLLSGKGCWIHNPISAYVAAVTNKQPIADDIGFHGSLAGPAGTHSAPSILSLGIWKFSKNADLAKELILHLFRKENYDAWIVASSAFNHPPLRSLLSTRSDQEPEVRDAPEGSGLRTRPELAGQAQRGEPARRRELHHPDMIAKAIAGMPTARAAAWAEDQVRAAPQGKLETKGKS